MNVCDNTTKVILRRTAILNWYLPSPPESWVKTETIPRQAITMELLCEWPHQDYEGKHPFLSFQLIYQLKKKKKKIQCRYTLTKVELRVILVEQLPRIWISKRDWKHNEREKIEHMRTLFRQRTIWLTRISQKNSHHHHHQLYYSTYKSMFMQ